MNIVGIGGLQNDPACVILQDGQFTAGVEQKKVARQYSRGSLPREAVLAALALADVAGSKVDYVAVVPPFPQSLEGELHLGLRAFFPNARLLLVEHHAAHAASAFFVSPFQEATVLTLDRRGDFRCGGRWRAHDNQLRLEEELFFPDSLGDLYGRVTQLLGFHANADEHKVQWLSASGDPSRFASLFCDLLSGGEAKSFPRFDRTFLEADRVGSGGFSEKFYARLGLDEDESIPQEMAADVAAGLQAALQTTVAAMAGKATNLCLAGGLAFNALLVSALEKVTDVFVQPAAGNTGTALGAVLYAWHIVLGQGRRANLDLFIGPGFNADEIKKVVENCKLRFRYLPTTGELIESAVRDLGDQKIIAWMQGRTEFGPRALGNRSILASPLDPYSTENINTYIKHREPFRKFAASVPEELCSEYFEAGPNARFLASVGRVKAAHRKTFESAVLGDGLVRVHAVHQSDNPLYHRLLHAAGKASGLPVLYNTSFNLFGDPMVATPRDAVRSFYSSGIDALYAGNFHLEK